jgi:hypothetical protein
VFIILAKAASQLPGACYRLFPMLAMPALHKQMCRHSRAGGNLQYSYCLVQQSLDSRLRGNDGVEELSGSVAKIPTSKINQKL